MSNPFADQKLFMEACGQSTDKRAPGQATLYDNLIEEEYEEFCFAKNEVEQLDAVMDLIVVLIGYAYSMGWNVEGAWKEVIRSNMAKVDPATGMVRRREDGKILKPEGWTPPALEAFV